MQQDKTTRSFNIDSVPVTDRTACECDIRGRKFSQFAARQGEQWFKCQHSRKPTLAKPDLNRKEIKMYLQREALPVLTSPFACCKWRKAFNWQVHLKNYLAVHLGGMIIEAWMPFAYLTSTRWVSST